jgi:D-glycero-D-manno-heptose 1,7-bisphosphate phosphatase
VSASARPAAASLLAGTTLVIFDADGTLRWTTREGQFCPYRQGEWRLMPNVRETLRALRWGEGGLALAIASNQNGVAEGLLSADMARRLLEETVAEAIGFVPRATAFEMCTCAIEAACGCRKPAPGLLLRAMARHGARGGQTLFVGDLDSDREAARRAGVRFAWASAFFGWPAAP